MIQPTLDSYAFDQNGGNAVLLDSTSIQPQAILFFDTFFVEYCSNESDEPKSWKPMAGPGEPKKATTC